MLAYWREEEINEVRPSPLQFRVYTETGVDPQFGPVVGNNPISK